VKYLHGMNCRQNEHRVEEIGDNFGGSIISQIRERREWSSSHGLLLQSLRSHCEKLMDFVLVEERRKKGSEGEKEKGKAF
jgi:hypothetical protein